ncbi:MAG: DUF3365 domain-containing protein [Myxococcaceae bacterium]
MTATLVLWLTLTAPPGDAGNTSAASEPGRVAVAPFKRALKDALVEALARSPEAAIDVCAKKAPELARTHSHDGVRVGRTSTRLRSSANAAPPWVAPLLTQLSTASAGSDASATVSLPDGRRGYAEAIWVQPMCLTCHGKSLTEPVRTALATKYPADAAQGYEAGEFRGVFWAELPR